MPRTHLCGSQRAATRWGEAGWLAGRGTPNRLRNSPGRGWYGSHGGNSTAGAEGGAVGVGVCAGALLAATEADEAAPAGARATAFGRAGAARALRSVGSEAS